MKPEKLTPTKAPLPQNEMLIGGDANPKLFNKRDLKQIEKEYQQHKAKRSRS